MKIFSLLVLMCGLNVAVAKSVVMPNPFLEPLVEGRLDAEQEWVTLPVSGDHRYGARRPEKAVTVEVSPLTPIEKVEFKISTGVINRGPYMSMLNISLVHEDKKYSFPATASRYVGNYSAENIDIQFKLEDVCAELGCDFIAGELVYLYIDYKGVREIKPIYEWDYMIGAYYLFKYQQ